MAGETQLRDYLKRVTADLHRTKRALDELRSRAAEPVAVVGIGCRVPGAAGPDALWELVAAGRDAITAVPADRGWPAAARRWRGGFLDAIDRFDADFFGVPPREAVTMDPQQRLLLETTWEAVEHARIDPRSLRGEKVGVFVGTSGQTYADLLRGSVERDEGHISTGNTASVLSGRLAYTLGLHGPAVTVDTACSSSAVATHLAVRSLRSGESTLALAGGVSIVSVPELFAEFDRQGGIAADGRCKAFAAAADGTSWAEGVAVLVLARLADARRLGYPVLAVIRGSAVNSDGATSGLTVPNGPAQQRVIRAALADAGLQPGDIDAVEAHGTGTSLGDPIEAAALMAVYGADRTGDPLWLGSLKSNIGHTQAAAGAAGIAKVVGALRACVLPRTLHAEEPSPHVDWAGGGVALLDSPRPWPRGERPRRAGVSSFGFSGTNAHLVIEEAPAEDAAERGPAREPLPWVLSGRTAQALRAQAARLLAHPAADTADPRDVAHSLAVTRSAFEHRLAVIADGAPARRAALTAWLAEGAAPAVVAGTAADEPATALLFAGQGSQRAGMGAGLAARFPVFADAYAAALAAVDAELGHPLRATIDSGDGLDDTGAAQPALFAVEVALFRLLESWGVRPEALVGHSVGEIAAAHAAGVLTLPDAARLVVARATLMARLPSGGAMLSVRAAEDVVRPLLGESAVIAAVNAPDAVVVAGPEAAVDAAAERLSAAGVRSRRLPVSHAFHSPAVEPVLDRFRAAIGGIRFGAARIPLVSTVTGAPAAMDTVEYWVDQIRRPVRFADAVANLGADVLVEVGPDGSLSAVTPGAVPLLRRGRGEEECALAAAAALHMRGVAVDWSAVLPDGRRVDLPTYAFQRASYWPTPLADPPGAACEDESRDLHETTWVRVPDLPPAVLTGRWLAVVPPGASAPDLGVQTDVVTVDALDTLDTVPGTYAGVVAARGLRVADVVTVVQAGIDAPLWLIADRADALWGLGAVIAAEHPDRWGGLVELAADADPALLRQVLAAGTEDQVRVDAAGVSALRMVPAAGQDRPVPERALVVGAGAVGSAIAEWLVERGIRRLVLTSRSGPAERLRELGAEVVVAAADFTDADAMAAALAGESVDAAYVAVRVLGDAPLERLDPAAAQAAADTVAAGLAVVGELVGAADLVIAGSLAGVLGGPGQAGDAIAHAVAAAAVAERRERGLPATVLAWPRWADPGARERLGRAGITATPRAMLDALDRATGVVAVAEADWARYAAVLPRPPRLLPAVPAVRPPVPRGTLLELVRARAAAVLGHGSADAVAADRSFQSLGFDSLSAVELRTALAADLGRDLPATLVFDHPTPAALAAHLGGQDRAAPAVAHTAETEDRIAIVGMACRYPGGVTSPDELWDLVAEGRDGTGPFPADRGWDLAGLAASGGSATARGGFLTGIDRFDAAFFGISPREAVAMDPQQRLVLETSWAAVESAGIDPRSLAGTATGVFVGANVTDYPELLRRSAADVLAHVGLGNAASVLSGRVAYLLGLEGPALSVDTACSSSLVALHLAARSLRSGESDLALAGGVLLMTTPAAFVDFTAQGGLAPDGRCKAFSADADGTGWAEGVGVLVLERLSDARRNGHRVLALVAGTAVNSDGASNGLTAPNGPSQERVIRQALANAGLSPSDVDAVEAHGTGTPLGDPIEARALLNTYGRDRERPLLLGSVKSNIGHAQSAAGVAGVIKVVQAMRHGVLPPTLHAETPTPHVDWTAGAVELLAAATPWPATGRPRRAAVSAFGVSGTNAHVIIEQAAEPIPAAATTGGPVPWVLSAKTPSALRAQAARLAAHLAANPDLDLAAAGRTLAVGRAAFPHRAAVAGTAAEVASGLAAVAAGEPGLVGEVSAPAKLAVVFAGQGSQRAGMGLGLAARHPVFADALAEVAAHLDLPVPLGRALGDAELLARTEYAQPALFAVEVALYRLVQSWGVTADFLIGHSVGELAAAHVSGALSLADAAELAAIRGRLMQGARPGGAMVAVAAPLSEVEPLITAGVDIAAVNGPRAVVIAGDEDPVVAVAAELAARGAKTRRLPVAHAFHSSHMDTMTEEFARAVRGRDARPPAVPVVSTLTGEVAADFADPEHWAAHARRPVRFADAVRTAARLGARVFLELGPDGGLSAHTQDVGAAVPLLRGDRAEDAAAAAALAALHVHGVPVDWSARFAGAGLADLPTYPFQGRRFWPEDAPDAPGEDDGWWTDLTAADDPAAALGVAPDALATVLPALAAYRDRNRADAVRYRVGWVPVEDAPRPVSTGTWAAIVPHGVDTAVLGGLSTIVIEHSGDLRDELRKLPGDLTGVVSLLALADAPEPTAPASLAATVDLVNALGETGVSAPLWCLTRGAVSAAPGEALRAPAQAGVWGLGRGVALEHPDRWGGLVDLPEQTGPDTADRLAALLANPGGEDQIALRETARARRLLPAPSGGAPGADVPTGGTVLITGGTGALGGHIARALAREGVPRLVLTSRRGPDAPGADDLRAELAELGAQVRIAACDAADAAALAALLAGVDDLTGVVHAAGVLDDGMLADLTAERLNAMLAAKSVAAWNLHTLTLDRPVTRFVLCASIAGSIGAAAQASYAAANALLDALAEHRAGLGLPALSVSWSPWAGSGMGVDAAVEAWMRRAGVTPLDPDRAVTALNRALRLGDTTLTVADIDWSRYAPGLAAVRPTRLLDAIPAALAALTSTEDEGDVDPGGLADELAEMSDPERDAVLTRLVRTAAAAVLGYADSAEIAAEQAFTDLGFDSLTSVEFRNRLAAATGLDLARSVVFDYPTPAALAERLRALLLPEPPAGDPVLAEVDRLEKALADSSADAAERAVVAERLRALAARWDAQPDDGQPDDAPDLLVASDDEVFEFIGKEFGIS